MGYFLHYVDLGMQVFEIEAGGEDPFVDNFDCDWLVGGDDLAAIDGGIGALSEELFEGELVFLYSFLALH